MQEKRTYNKPFIQVVEIDNSISLAMKSEDPGGPPEDLMKAKPQENQKDPFSSNPFGAGTKKK